VTVPDVPADEVASRLRAGTPPVVGRVESGKVLLDLRSVLPDEDAVLERALRDLASEG
jgi:L-seryl-tRNA(Ser) seleniumtransferase